MCIVTEPRCQNVVGHFRVTPSPKLPDISWQEMYQQNQVNETTRTFRRLHYNRTTYPYRVLEEGNSGFFDEAKLYRAEDWPGDCLVNKFKKKYDWLLGKSVWTLHTVESRFKNERKRQRKKEMVWAKLAGGSPGKRGGKNFMIFQIDMGTSRACFTFFPKSGDVVVCGSKSEEEMNRAADRFCAITGTTYKKISTEATTQYLDSKLHEEHFTPIEPWVTNMTWSGVVGCRGFRKGLKTDYIMRALAKYCEDNKANGRVSVQMRSTFFPGAYLRHVDHRGVINVFSNGSYVIVGVRKGSQAKRLQEWLRAIMSEYWTTRARVQSCACNADLSSVTLSEEDQTLQDKFGPGSEDEWEDISEGFYYAKIGERAGEDARAANAKYLSNKLSPQESEGEGIVHYPPYYKHREESLNLDGSTKTISDQKQETLEKQERDALLYMMDEPRPLSP